METIECPHCGKDLFLHNQCPRPFYHCESCGYEIDEVYIKTVQEAPTETIPDAPEPVAEEVKEPVLVRSGSTFQGRKVWVDDRGRIAW